MEKEFPLERKWCWWYHIKNFEQSYNDNQILIGEFNNVIDFWRFFNNIPNPEAWLTSQTGLKKINGTFWSSLSLFEKGIEPKWEDPVNSKGGEISLRKYKNVSTISSHWLDLILSIIGEQFKYSEDIVGIRIVDSSIVESSFKKRFLYRIEIWFRDINKKNNIENFIKNTITIPHYIKLLYKPHKDSFEIRK